MSTLLILSYNEASTIRTVIEKYCNNFEYLIVIDDDSKDETKSILNNLDIDVIYHKNSKNLGAGKSFEIGLDIFNNLESNSLVKIDGDDQFDKEDVINISKIGNSQDFDFIKCDRFWEGGIQGNIPFIRYFGNALASFLVKLATGNWKINDPLNGLFYISKKVSINFKLTKLFYRYGYPFFLITHVSNLSKYNSLNIGQYSNIVTYGNEKSSLKAGRMFFKLIYYTLKSYYSKIKIKMKFSTYQFSALIDIISQIFMLFSFYSCYKFVTIRYFSVFGPQGTWFILTVIFLIIFLSLLIVSQKLESNTTPNKITIL
ncbi:MAG: hypothetical protein CMC29_03450 [Flavobacteriaceae bacterium]|nr:hypothetical protein [Flavobacteriaceae bacterium]